MGLALGSGAGWLRDRRSWSKQFVGDRGCCDPSDELPDAALAMQDRESADGNVAAVLELPPGLGERPTDISRLARVDDPRSGRLERVLVAVGEFLRGALGDG